MTAPKAAGSLPQASLARVLLQLFEQRLSGSLEVAEDGGGTATLVLVRGRITKVRTTAAVAYLGTVLYELGFIDGGELDASLLQMAKSRLAHGRVLLDRKSITREELAAGLREQLHRKMTYLLGAATAATPSFHADTDRLPAYGGHDWVLVDPHPAIWRHIRDSVPADQVRGLLTRLGDRPCRLAAGAAVERFLFQADERSVVECLRIKPLTVAELHALGALPPPTVGLLLFCLFFTNQIETLGAASATPSASRAPSPGVSQTRPAVGHVDRASIIRARARAIGAETFHQRLGVGEGATRAEIERAFTALAAKWDPSALPHELGAVRDDCARVLLALGEAYQALRERRRDGRTETRPTKSAFERAKACLANGDLDEAERLAHEAHREAPDAADPMALLAWIEAQRPGRTGVAETLRSIATLDAVNHLDPLCQDALYYRAQLHSRLENHRSAFRDLRTLLEINPKHLDAMRAFRLYQFRVRSGSVRMRAVDPHLLPRGTTSGVVPKLGVLASGKLKRG